MPEGFFLSSKLTSSSCIPSSPKCGACGLFRKCNSPKMPPTGNGKKGILVVAEAPGQHEDDEGEQLIGPAGQELRKRLNNFDIDLDRDCWKHNAVICRPPNNEMKDVYIECCRPNLLSVIKELNPRTIILLGGSAIDSLIGSMWRHGEDVKGMGHWVGWQIPSQKHNAWICPNWHPSYLLREKNNKALSLWFDKYLESAIDLHSRPWPDGVPDYQSEVECVYEADRAAKIIRKMIEKGGNVAFDYETNMVKPDSQKASIYSCSVCWEGKKTIAFPWIGDAVQAMSELLLSPLGKIGWNIKFEERWTQRMLRHPINNWIYDGMVGTHVLDGRSGITSAKFQALTILGLPPYDESVRPYFDTGKENNIENKISKANIADVLLYNGMDALVEYKIWEIQRIKLALGGD